MRKIIHFYRAVMLVLIAATVFFGADTLVGTALFSMLLLALAGTGLFINGQRKIPPFVVVGVFFLMVFGLKDLVLGWLAKGMSDYLALLAAVGVFLLGLFATQNPARVKQVWQFMLVLFLIFSCWAFLDFMIAPEVIFGQPRPWHEDRLSAAFLSANTAGTFVGMMTILSMSTVLKTLSGSSLKDPVGMAEMLFRHAIVALLCLLVALTCLMLTASRAGIAVTGFALLVLIVWELLLARSDEGGSHTARSAGFIGVLAVGMAALLVLFWALSGDVAGARYADLDDDVSSRQVMFSAYWSAFKRAPFFGYGFGSFAQINARMMTPENAHILATQGAAHNVVLQWLLQVGLVGSMIMWAVILYLHYQLWKGITRRKRYRSNLRGILCVSLLIVLHGMADFALEIPAVMWWWAFILGAGFGIAKGQTGVTNRRQKG